MVPLRTGTFTRFFFASSTPLAIAAVTYLALPSPYPTTAVSFPSTTMAENLKRRQRLVTLVTLCMLTRRSLNSISLDLTLCILAFDIPNY